VPFAVIAALALAATTLQTEGTDWPLVAVAAAYAVLAVQVARTLPWRRLPLSGACMLPFAFDGLIGILRQAQGGSISGYSPLAVLPVVWIGLTQGRRAVMAITAATTLLFALPMLLVGGHMYPSSGWRGVVLWTVVSLVLGFAANRVITAQREQAALARGRALELDQLVEAQAAIATSRLDLDALVAAVAERVLRVSGGDGAVIEVLEGDHIRYAAVAGIAEPFGGMRMRAEGTISGECLRSQRTLISRDTESDPRVDRAACRKVGARSMIVAPLVFDGDAMGVLKVYAGATDTFDEAQGTLLTALAQLVAAGMARARLLEALAELAVTDELTGLTNRREWHRHLELAMARASRSHQPLGVLLMDVDGLKRVNDDLGHAAGDDLLKCVASRWAATLRRTDLLGRLGGDEFAVVLEDTDEEAARLLIARLDAALDAHQSASIGIAMWDGAGDGSALVARADAAMYESKRGRNRLRVA
jgi:diguanylate cyclase (GGDEF)-like protein